MYYYILIGIIIILFVLLLSEKRNNSKEKKKTADEVVANIVKQEAARIAAEKARLEEELSNTQREISWKQDSLNANLAAIQTAIDLNKQLLQQEEARKDELIAHGQEIINKDLEQYKQQQLNKINQDLNDKLKETADKYEDTYNSYQSELDLIKQKLDSFRSQRAALNEAIRLEQEKEQRHELHHLTLSNNDKEDIKYLLTIEDKLHNKEVLHKLIWSDFLQKPFNEMIKRQFGADVPECVIYCIEDSTGRKYIGKTVSSVDKRWREHIKSSLHISQISHQLIHDAMFGRWDEFSFSVVEKVNKENITEKEKFYINTFQSQQYGYNIKG